MDTDGATNYAEIMPMMNTSAIDRASDSGKVVIIVFFMRAFSWMVIQTTSRGGHERCCGDVHVNSFV